MNVANQAVRPRRVLHVLNSATGGAALSAMGLMDAFWKEGIAACAVCDVGGSERERDLIREATHGQVLFMPLHWWSKKTRSALWKRPLLHAWEFLQNGWGRRSAEHVAQFAREQGADLIHTNTILTPEGGIAARRLGLPHVWHLREVLGPKGAVRLSREDASLGRYLERHASVVVANSHITAATVRDWIPADLLRVVPNGIDLARFRVRENYAAAGRPLIVAMVASLTSRWKKHALFLEAAAKVDRSLPVEFRIYGHESTGHSGTEDRYAANLRDMIRELGLKDRFTWPGYLSDPAEIMSQIDILAHPADAESFGRVAVEAMAAGLPVVGVRGGGIGEIVQDGTSGFLAEPDRADQMAAAIDRLARDESQRRTMGQAGRRRAVENYSLEACAAGILGAYELAMQRPLSATD